MSEYRGPVRGPFTARYAAALGDDALIMAERCFDLVTRAPTIEEDLAIANIGLDLLGQARALLGYAGEIEGCGRDEDDLAYLRTEQDFRCLQIVELPNDDFALTMARLYLLSTYHWLLHGELAKSSDATLAAIASKSLKEVAYHRDHAALWMARLAGGTEESMRRLTHALTTLAPFIDEVFDGAWILAEDEDAVVDPGSLRVEWNRVVGESSAVWGIELPTPGWTARGGRVGHHTEYLGPMLAMTQSVHRAYPGASW